MSYEKTTWQNGDTITAEKLNKIESGIAGSVMSIGMTMEPGSTSTLNKTWKEICDHIALGGIAIIINETDENCFKMSIIKVVSTDGSEAYGVIDYEDNRFTTDNENGYPVYTFDEPDAA